MTRISLADAVARFRGSESFLVTSHVGADGDAVGSLLAVKHLLNAMGKHKVACVLDGPVPEIYQWLSGAEQIVQAGEVTETYETAIILDVAQEDRIGAVADVVRTASETVVIDHHLAETPWGDYGCVDASYAATGAIVAELFDEAEIPIAEDVAECIYVALTTDTGGFRHANSDPKSHRIAARLLETGLDVPGISARVFDRMSRSKFGLLTCFVNSVSFSESGRVAYGSLTGADFVAAGAKEEETEGLINFARNIDGVDVAILFRETRDGATKVSFRSRKGINCADILSAFGGGGHAGAAGATLHEPLDSARAKVLERVHVYLEETS